MLIFFFTVSEHLDTSLAYEAKVCRLPFFVVKQNGLSKIVAGLWFCFEAVVVCLLRGPSPVRIPTVLSYSMCRSVCLDMLL